VGDVLDYETGKRQGVGSDHLAGRGALGSPLNPGDPAQLYYPIPWAPGGTRYCSKRRTPPLNPRRARPGGPCDVQMSMNVDGEGRPIGGQDPNWPRYRGRREVVRTSA